MMSKRNPFLKMRELGNHCGVTLMELIIAIVIIGIAIPTIMIPFSGLTNVKKPEYVVQASFLAQKYMEKISEKARDTVSCATDIPTSDGSFTLTCTEEDVDSADLDTDVGADSFAKKITLTISRTEMGDLKFYTLFALDS